MSRYVNSAPRVAPSWPRHHKHLSSIFNGAIIAKLILNVHSYNKLLKVGNNYCNDKA